MPLAHILMPQIARKAEEIAAATGHPSPTASGYLNRYAGPYNAGQAAFGDLGSKGGDAFVGGFDQGADAGRAALLQQASGPARKGNEAVKGKAYLQDIKHVHTGSPMGLKRELEDVTPLPNANAPDNSQRFAQDWAADRLRNGQSPWAPEMAMSPGTTNTNLAEMALNMGLTPDIARWADEDQAKAAAAAAKPAPNYNLGDISAKDVVREGAYAQNPNVQLLPNAAPGGPITSRADEIKRATPSADLTAKEKKQMKDIADLVKKKGYLSLIYGVKDPGKVAENLGRAQDAVRRTALGDLDPTNIVYNQ